MKKRKRNLLQRMMAVLLSVVLVIGMVAGAAPTEVLAAESESEIETEPETEEPALQEGAQDTEIETEPETEESALQEGAQDAANGDEPTSVSAQDAEAAVSYGLWVNGIRVTDANAANVLGDSTVSYAPDTNVLTLNGANLTTSYKPDNYNYDSAVIYADSTFGPLKLNIQGTNTITASGDSYYVSGILAKGPVEFSGDGSLTVTAENQYTYGTGYAVNSNADVTITGGTYSFTGTGGASGYGYGMCAGSNTGGNGKVCIKGGTLTTIGAGGYMKIAIAGNLVVSQNPKYEVIASLDASGMPETDYDPVNFSLFAYIKVMPWIEPEYDKNGFSTDGRFFQPAVQADDGYYEIKNAGNLYWFAEQMKSDTANAYENVRLTEDITIPAGMNWKPISVGQWNMPYQGTFDGNGKSISDLSVFRDATEFYDTSASSGLFNTIGDDGVVKNLTMRNTGIKVTASAGAICGTNYGTIENCCNFGGEICVSTSYAGGIAGFNEGKIVRCFNTGTVYAQDESVGDCVGGICGYASEYAVIENCYNTGTIGNANVIRAGGVTGGYRTGAKITGCYNIGAVTARDDTGGIGCYVDGSQPLAEDIKNNYYLAKTESDDGGRTVEQFASGEVAWLLNEGNTDGTQAYYQTCGEGTPAFTGRTVYRVMSYQCPGDSDGKVAYNNAAGNVTGDHSFGAWTMIKQPTESEEGLQERSCSVCGYKQTKAISETGGESPDEGEIEVDKEQGENTPDVAFGMSKDDLILAVLTPEEQSLVEEGTDIRITLVIDNIDASVSQSDKQAVTDKAGEYKVGEYLDINLYKIIGTDRTKISHTNGTIRIALTIPDSLRNTDSGTTRSYAVVRVHDGAAELLPDLDGAADTITIETDMFSTYALVYKDSTGTVISDNKNNDSHTADTEKDDEPKTGDTTSVEIYATAAMIAGFTYLILFFENMGLGMTEEAKKELTASIIAWAKKGGMLRKIAALAAIFLILFYYHSIGKRTSVNWKQVYE